MKTIQTMKTEPVAPQRIHHVALNVVDLNRSIDFYERVVGLEVVDRDDHYAKLNIGGDEIALFQLPSDAVGERPGSDATTGSLNHIAFAVPASVFHLYHERIQSEGITITFGPVQRRRGKALYFLDPDGNKIELFCFQSRHAETKSL
jgi:catechol 2,3-dioxygenase-like lactoylglutathione lyase family enzyme